MVWQKLCEGIGLEIDGSAYIGGHPDCNQGATLLVKRRRGRYPPLLPNDEKTKRLFAEILATLGAISTMTTDARAGASLLPSRVAGAFARHPTLALRSFARALMLIGSGQNSMASRVANAPNDPITQARLAPCVFKGAVKNRASGEWEAVPMCAMNQSRCAGETPARPDWPEACLTSDRPD